MTNTIHPGATAYVSIMNALDSTPRTLLSSERAQIADAILDPSPETWRRARLVRVTGPCAGHPAGINLWQALLLRFKPSPMESIQVPTGAQIIAGLNHAQKAVI